MNSFRTCQRYAMLIWTMASLLILFLCQPAFAAPAFSELQTTIQPDGTKFNARIMGDEWGNWNETDQGEVIVKSSDGYWNYAEEDKGKGKGHVKSSGARVGKDLKPAKTLKSKDWAIVQFERAAEIKQKTAEKIKERNTKDKIKIGATTNDKSSAELNSALMDSDPSIKVTNIEPKQTNVAAPTEPHKMLVLLVGFNDETIQNSEAYWQNVFFGTTGKTVNNYYKEVSNNQFYFLPAEEAHGTSNDGVVSVTLNYAHPNTGNNTNGLNQQIVRDALAAADGSINYAGFDTNGNGDIEFDELHVVTIIAGYERSYSNTSPSVWGHRWALFNLTFGDNQGNYTATFDGKRLCYPGYGGYTQQGETHLDHPATIGILAHELGHDLGLVDVYDTSYQTQGVGVHSLMGAGSWGLSSGDAYSGQTPTHIDPYQKAYLQWFTPANATTTGTYTLSASTTNDYNIVKVPTADPKQYFLVENRQLSGFDAGLYYQRVPNGGVAIWHIDDNINTTTNWNSNNINNTGAVAHKGIDVEEANLAARGKAQLDYDSSSPSYDNPSTYPYDHYFRSGGVSVFSDGTTPNAKLYNSSDSGAKITVASASGNAMTVVVGNPTFQFDSASYTVAEGGTATITVTRTGSAGAASVSYATSNGTATAGSDYTTVSGTLSFAAGEASKTFALVTLADTTTEGSETVNLTLSTPAPTGFALGSQSTATITITEGEGGQPVLPGVLAFSSATYSAAENAGSATITVNRTGGSDGTVTVDYATSDGTARAGSDYIGISGQLSFANGEISKTLIIQIINDEFYEGNKTVNLTLSNASGGATIGMPSTSIFTIAEDETPPGTIAFSSTSYSVNEMDQGIIITLNRTGGTGGTVTIDYATSNGTASGADYVPANGTLTFGPGETVKTVFIGIIDDFLYETNETIFVSLSNPTGGGDLGSPANTTITIVDNDELPGQLVFSAGNYSVNENTISIPITVNRISGSGGTVSVGYAASSSTAGSSDYIPVSGTLTFAPGETSKTFQISVIDDSIYEGNETVNISLSNPVGGAILGSPSTAVLTIVDNETPPGALQFSSSTYSVNESGVTVNITVSRVGGSGGAVSVNYSTIHGTASSLDYIPQSGTLTFTNGETVKNFSIPIIDDYIYEGNETVNVRLSNPTGGAVLGTPSTATLTIVDNETPAGVLEFSSANFSVAENGITAVISVRRIGGSSGTVSISYAATRGTASSMDFIPTSGTLTFKAGETSKSFNVYMLDDTTRESNETVNLSISNPTGGATLGGQRTAVLTITDND